MPLGANTQDAVRAATGETYGYDSFGNLTSKTPTAGAPPTLSQAPNPANNLVGQSYDANGNQMSAPGFYGALLYDAENRMVGAPGVQYAYDSRNQRIWTGILDSSNNLTGQTVNPGFADSPASLAAYFGGKRVTNNAQSNPAPYLQDRLGSNRTSGWRYYPWGEDHTTLQPNDQVKFATYTRDSATLLDYADQRYYSSIQGRFMTPDPYRADGGGWGDPRTPQSWNRYAYAQNDPINFNDPTGQFLDFGCSYGGDSGLETPCEGPIEGCLAGGFEPAESQSPCTGSTCVEGDGFTPMPGPFCPGPAPTPAPQPPVVTPDCNTILTDDISQYLGSYDGGSSPLNTSANIATLVSDGMQDDVDPRFIVALSIAETQGGTNMNWGPYNAWDIQVRNPNYNGPNKQPPYTSWSQSISGINGLIAGNTYFGAGLTTTSTIYAKFQGPGYQTGLVNLNTALGQMSGNQNLLTDPCNLKNLRPPNQ